jgi:hypothetical protein
VRADQAATRVNNTGNTDDDHDEEPGPNVFTHETTPTEKFESRSSSDARPVFRQVHPIIPTRELWNT